MNTIYYHSKDTNNFGDEFNKWLCEKLTGREFTWAENMSTLICGSHLQDARCETHIWGAGFGSMFQECYELTPIVHTLRGIYSAIRLMQLGWVSGSEFIGFFDPMMVLNEFFTQRTGHGVGLIRHYADYDGTDCGLDEIDVCAGVDDVVDFILQHDAIITSSLHGLIAADILGRKSALVSFGDRIDTDGFKYADYFSSAGYTGYKPIQVDNKSLLDIVPELRNVAPPVQSKEYLKQLTTYLNEN